MPEPPGQPVPPAASILVSFILTIMIDIIIVFAR